MHADEQIAALLHVAAVVAVITLAFLGMDKAHIDLPNYKDGINPAKEKAKAVLLRLGLSGKVPVTIFGHDILLRLSTTFPAAVICLIADDPLHLGFVLKVFLVAYRQRHIPSLEYFKRFNHDRVVGCIAMIATLTLVGAAAGIIFDRTDLLLIFNGWIIKGLLITLSLGLGWIIWCGRAMRMLSEENLGCTCDRLGELITARFSAAQQREMKRVDKTKRRLKSRREILKHELARTERQLDNLDQNRT